MQSLISYLNSEDTAHEASEEVESAIALTLSLSSKDSVVDELIKAQYPFLAFKTDEGDIIFDLLLLTETEKNQTATFDVKAAVNELIDSKYEERGNTIQGCRSVITS